MAKLSEENIKRIEKLAKEARASCSRVEFAGRALFECHCGMRMAKVKVFFKTKGSPRYCPKHEEDEDEEFQTKDELVCVCPECFYHFTPYPPWN